MCTFCSSRCLNLEMHHAYFSFCLFVWFLFGGDSSFIFYCFYLTEKCCIFTVNIRFVLRSYGTLSERKEQWHHPAAEQAQWDTRYKHPCEWTLDQKHSLFFNPFGLLIKRNNKQTQNTVKDACAYDSHSDLSINMTLCKVPGICYFQLLFLFHINGNRNFWSPALLIWQKQRDLTSLPHLGNRFCFNYLFASIANHYCYYWK